MESYILLRDNQEKGPYSLEGLKALSLRKTDLIWVEGRSAHWKYATEFEELEPFVTQAPVKREPPALLAPRREAQPSTSAPAVDKPQMEEKDHKKPQLSRLPGGVPAASQAPFAVLNKPVMPVFKERKPLAQEDYKFEFPKPSADRSALWIFSLFTMLVFAAFVIKEMVETSSGYYQMEASSSLLPIRKAPEKKVADMMFQNAIKKESGSRRVAVEEVKKQVSVSSTAKAPLFKSVDDLHLGIANSSDQALEKVELQLTYVKEDGNILRKENHSVYSLGPRSKKTLVVPSAKKGAKIKYKVEAIELKGSKGVKGQA